MTNSTSTLTVTDIATLANLDARTTRKFLRATIPAESHPGRGAQWAIKATPKQVESLVAKAIAWGANRGAATIDAGDLDLD